MRGWRKAQLESWLSRSKTAEFEAFEGDTLKLKVGNRKIHCRLTSDQQVRLATQILRNLQREAPDPS